MDVESLAENFVDLEAYVGRQEALNLVSQDSHGRIYNLMTFFNKKSNASTADVLQSYVGGVPDSQKRSLLLEYFKLDSMKCFISYQQTKRVMGDEFMNFTR